MKLVGYECKCPKHPRPLEAQVCEEEWAAVKCCLKLCWSVGGLLIDVGDEEQVEYKVTSEKEDR